MCFRLVVLILITTALFFLLGMKNVYAFSEWQASAVINFKTEQVQNSVATQIDSEKFYLSNELDHQKFTTKSKEVVLNKYSFATYTYEISNTSNKKISYSLNLINLDCENCVITIKNHETEQAYDGKFDGEIGVGETDIVNVVVKINKIYNNAHLSCDFSLDITSS